MRWLAFRGQLQRQEREASGAQHLANHLSAIVQVALRAPAADNMPPRLVRDRQQRSIVVGPDGIEDLAQLMGMCGAIGEEVANLRPPPSDLLRSVFPQSGAGETTLVGIATHHRTGYRPLVRVGVTRGRT